MLHSQNYKLMKHKLNYHLKTKAMSKIFFPIIFFLYSISYVASSQDATSEVIHPYNEDCNNGEISIIINNGFEPITYIWSNGANDQTLNNLEEGEYSVHIVDALCDEVTIYFELICECSFDIYISELNRPSLLIGRFFVLP